MTESNHDNIDDLSKQLKELELQYCDGLMEDKEYEDLKAIFMRIRNVKIRINELSARSNN